MGKRVRNHEDAATIVDRDALRQASRLDELLAQLDALVQRVSQIELDSGAAYNLATHADRGVSRLDEALAGATTELAENGQFLRQLREELEFSKGEISAVNTLAFHVDQQITRLDLLVAALEQRARQTERGGRHFGFLRQAQYAANPPNLTFVCSRGRTGTRWLAQALNMHKDILAAHGPGAPPHSFQGKKTATTAVIDNQAWFKHLAEQTLNESYRDIVRVDQAKFYCYVHALSLHEVAEKLGGELTGLRINVVNIIRHPVTRVNSFHRYWLQPDDQRDQDYLLGRWKSEEMWPRYCERIAAVHQVDFDKLENIFFVMACHWLSHDREDFDFAVQHFPFEWIVSDRAAFKSMLAAAFGPTLQVSEHYLKRVFSLGRTNTRTNDFVRPERVYARWKPWQRYCFALVLEGIDLTAQYRDFGYDFSFLEGP